MNEYMQGEMIDGRRGHCVDNHKVRVASYEAGFNDCYDLLMPLLQQAATHVIASHGAEHMMDGFRPQKRPIDGLVEQIKRVTE